MRKIIAVGHHKNVGKDTFVTFCIDILRTETRKLRVVRRGFADKVYELCYSAYQWAGFKPKAYYEENPERKNEKLLTGHTVRETLIKTSNKLREFDPDIWLNANLKNEDYDILFVTDMRFPNEFETVESMGGMTVRIMRPNLPVPTDEADTALNHYTERWRFNFQNNEDKKKLYAMAESFTLTYILERK